MRIKLSVNDVPYSGYINIDPVPLIEKDKADQYQIIPQDFRNLNGVVENAECHEILAHDILDYVHVEDVANVVTHIVSKLRHNGIIIIGGTDIEIVAKLYLNGEIDTVELNHIIHGTNEHSWSMRQGQITLEELENILLNLKLEILEKNIDGTHIYIKARRK